MLTKLAKVTPQPDTLRGLAGLILTYALPAVLKPDSPLAVAAITDQIVATSLRVLA